MAEGSRGIGPELQFPERTLRSRLSHWDYWPRFLPTEFAESTGTEALDFIDQKHGFVKEHWEHWGDGGHAYTAPMNHAYFSSEEAQQAIPGVLWLMGFVRPHLRAQKIGFNVLEPDGETPLHKDPFDVTVFKLLGRGVGSVTDPPNGGITILETEPGDMFRLYGQRWSWWRARHGFTNRQPDEMRVGTYFPDPKR